MLLQPQQAEVIKAHLSQCVAQLGLSQKFLKKGSLSTLSVLTWVSIIWPSLGGDTPESQFFDGGYVGQKRKQFNAKRREYATKNLWSKLKSSKDKERRFMKDQNHKISRAIVDLASKYPNSCIVMEKLDGIRKRISGTKKQNRRVHNYNFAQLQEFVQYKAHYTGIAYRKVLSSLQALLRSCDKEKFSKRRPGRVSNLRSIPTLQQQ